MVHSGLARIRGWEETNRVHFDSIFIVGDSIHDVDSAERNGLMSVGVLSSGEDADDLKSAGATRVVESASHVMATIGGLVTTGR